MQRDIDGQTFTRTLALDVRAANKEAREVPASLSSGEPVLREGFDGAFAEVLVHSAEAIDMSRAENGLPLLFGHDHGQPIGVVRDVRLDGDRVRGTLAFGNSAKAREVWEDVRDGFLQNISIGYRINRHEWVERSSDERAAGKVDELRATRWQLFEASVVSVPADQTVGINRSINEVIKMADEKAPEQKPTGKSEGGASAVISRLDESRRLGVEAERARRAQIREAFAPVMHMDGVRELFDEACDSDWAPETAARELLKFVGSGAAPIARDPVQSERRQPRIEQGATDVEKMVRGIDLALQVRSGNKVSDKEEVELIESGLRGHSLLELAREFVRVADPGKRSLGRYEIPGAAFMVRAPIAHGVASFANLLENTARKSMLRGFAEAPEVYQAIVRTIEVPDFKSNSLLRMTGMTDLKELPASGELEGVTAGDLKETIQLKTYGGRFDINRNAIINDDMGALSRIPAALGQAAARNVGDVVFDALIGGTTLTLAEDSTAVFHANHANYFTTTGAGAPSTTTLDGARVAMAKQTDPKTGKALNIRWTSANPARVIVPVGLETATEIVAMTPNYAEVDYSGASQNTNNPNPFRGRIQVVADARLDADSAAQWYVLADPMLYDSLVLAFLSGMREPTVETETPWDTLGASFRVYHDVACAWADYRAAVCNDGAA